MSTHNVPPVRKISGRNYRNRNNWRLRPRDHRQDDTNRRGSKHKCEQSSQENGKRSRLDIGDRLKESDVGITEFIGKHAGFSAIIKERYTDFHVNEIDPDGQIVKLTNQDIPCEPQDEEDIEDLKKSIPLTIWDQLQVLKEENSPDLEIDVTMLNKTERRTIHTIAKRLANIVSQTVDKEDKKFITILRNTKGNKNRDKIRKDNRVDWKKRGGDYCHFLLHKVNMDTMDALNRLATGLRIRPDNLSYAGTKDRRAWTTQWVSLRKVEPRDILRAGKNIHGVYIGNFKYAKKALKLGMLRGNQFRIALRDIHGTIEEIECAMISLRDKGFINYYGLQRFGTIAIIPTHEIGKCLLQGRWHDAVELILKPRPNEQDQQLAEARQIYAETKDAYAAYAKIKRVDKIEARLLRGLQISGDKNPLGALDSVPRNIRLMYIHAYQSFVWNQMVSRRIKQFGIDVIVGDLVYDAQEEDIINETTDLLSDADTTKNENDIFIEEKTLDPTDAENEGESKQIEENKVAADIKEEHEDVHNLPAVKVLTEEDLANYTLADVIMPQPGWKVTYPPYARAWFDEFLAKDGLTSDLRQKNKKYSLSGTYRKILEIPTNLSWKMMYYKEKHDNLIMSDIDEMRKLMPPQNDPNGKKKALIIEMCLKSSTYATMALREILKNDTSATTQVTLSDSHDTENVHCSNQTIAEQMTKEDKSGSVHPAEMEKDNMEENRDIELHESTDMKNQTMELNEAKNTTEV